MQLLRLLACAVVLAAASGFAPPLRAAAPRPRRLFAPAAVRAEPAGAVAASYDLALGSAAVAALGAVTGALPVTGVFGVFAGFLAFQTTNLRFVFNDSTKTFDLVQSGGDDTGENFVVGGANSWKYDTFVNWDFFPSPAFPILVYFKETQTSDEKWDVGAGKLDESSTGQIHFFPAIANCAELAAGFERNGCAKVE